MENFSKLAGLVLLLALTVTSAHAVATGNLALICDVEDPLDCFQRNDEVRIPSKDLKKGETLVIKFTSTPDLRVQNLTLSHGKMRVEFYRGGQSSSTHQKQEMRATPFSPAEEEWDKDCKDNKGYCKRSVKLARNLLKLIKGDHQELVDCVGQRLAAFEAVWK